MVECGQEYFTIKDFPGSYTSTLKNIRKILGERYNGKKK